jgi:hypothetical protein
MVISKLRDIDPSYESVRTEYSKHQGVCILYKKGNIKKVFKNDGSHLIFIQSSLAKQERFIIGAYFQPNQKVKILAQVKALIKRIKSAIKTQK